MKLDKSIFYIVDKTTITRPFLLRINFYTRAAAKLHLKFHKLNDWDYEVISGKVASRYTLEVFNIRRTKGRYVKTIYNYPNDKTTHQERKSYRTWQRRKLNTQKNKAMEKNREDATILQAAEKWPDSISRAFHIGDNNNVIYFMVKDPVRVTKGHIRSRVQCLKLRKQTGDLVETILTIKTQTVINPMTIKEFAKAVMVCYDNLADNEMIATYHEWGFRRD